MTEENRLKGKDETSRRKALEAHRSHALRKLQGCLERVTLHLTAHEYRGLVDEAGPGSVEHLLECFVADLTDSERRVWAHCHLEAHSWLGAHREGRAMIETLNAEQATMALGATERAAP